MLALLFTRKEPISLKQSSSHPTPPAHFNLVAAAHASMIEHGFHPDFPAGTDEQLAAIKAHPELPAAPGAQDLRNLLWSSIDNDTSKDLDQIEWAEQLADGRIRVLVGVADVDARVPRGTVINDHARSETTSVYTGVKVFPMLPAELSEGITSLNENEDRVAIVIEFTSTRPARAPTARHTARWCATARSWPTTAWAHGLKARPRSGQGGRQRRSGRAAQAAGRRRAAHGGRTLPAWRARS